MAKKRLNGKTIVVAIINSITLLLFFIVTVLAEPKWSPLGIMIGLYAIAVGITFSIKIITTKDW